MLLLKNPKMTWLAMAVFAIGLTVGPRAEAVGIYTNSPGTPITTLLEGSGNTTISFFVDVTGAAANISGVTLVYTTTGSIQLNGAATCAGGDFTCSGPAIIPSSGPASNNFATGGLGQGANFLLGSIDITVGAGPGTLQVAASPPSSILDFNFNSFVIAPGTVLVNTVIPEPSTLLLLGAGLTGLVLSGRRRPKN